MKRIKIGEVYIEKKGNVWLKRENIEVNTTAGLSMWVGESHRLPQASSYAVPLFDQAVKTHRHMW